MEEEQRKRRRRKTLLEAQKILEKEGHPGASLLQEATIAEEEDDEEEKESSEEEALGGVKAKDLEQIKEWASIDRRVLLAVESRTAQTETILADVAKKQVAGCIVLVPAALTKGSEFYSAMEPLAKDIKKEMGAMVSRLVADRLTLTIQLSDNLKHTLENADKALEGVLRNHKKYRRASVGYDFDKMLRTAPNLIYNSIGDIIKGMPKIQTRLPAGIHSTKFSLKADGIVFANGSTDIKEAAVYINIHKSFKINGIVIDSGRVEAYLRARWPLHFRAVIAHKDQGTSLSEAPTFTDARKGKGKGTAGKGSAKGGSS